MAEYSDAELARRRNALAIIDGVMAASAQAFALVSMLDAARSEKDFTKADTIALAMTKLAELFNSIADAEAQLDALMTHAWRRDGEHG